ncbi:MAG: aldolase/citrate lyase family protein [Pseudomonadota bacterium]
MAFGTFGKDARGGKPMVGTFLKTPEVMIVETLARSGIDFICIDGEHGPIDRARLDACLAVARALEFPVLVRVAAARAEYVLQALDAGAAGLVIPHVDSAEKAEEMGRVSRYGLYGRGFAGAVRGTDWGEGGMAAVLDRGADPMILVQIEEPAGVEAASAIAGAPGIDGVFVGPADLSVGYGHRAMGSDDVARAYRIVGKATKEAGRIHATFARSAEAGRSLKAHGVTMLFVASELSFMASAAGAEAEAFRA